MSLPDRMRSWLHASRPASAQPTDAFDERIVWIVGSPRTGSTWLLNLLGLHPRVRVIDEPLVGAHLGLRLASIVGQDAAGAAPGHVRVVDRYADRADYFFSARYRDVWL